MSVVSQIPERYLNNPNQLKNMLVSIKAGNFDAYSMRKSIAMHESTFTTLPEPYVAFMRELVAGFHECLVKTVELMKERPGSITGVVVITEMDTRFVEYDELVSQFEHDAHVPMRTPHGLSGFLRSLLGNGWRLVQGHCIRCCNTPTTALGPSAQYADPMNLVSRMMPEVVVCDHNPVMSKINCICVGCSPMCGHCMTEVLTPDCTIEMVKSIKTLNRCIKCAKDMLVGYKPPRPDLQQIRRIRSNLRWRSA